ncbi:MAG: chromate efflux transporter [Betaproteobacteria bacterium]|nr:chromate efflux transporter [Betaproteobacteria bacterium]
MTSSVPARSDSADTVPAGTAREVFTTFLRLGVTSFGGPVAHLVYFRRALVEQRRWIDGERYAQLMALCQFLPGPASSQLGFSLGLLRAGWRGGVAAFVGFTLPSVLLMLGLAFLIPVIEGSVGNSAVHGLKLVALAVVSSGLLGMARQLCPEPRRATIAAGAAALLLLASTPWMQLIAIGLGALGGWWFLKEGAAIAPIEAHSPRNARTGVVLLLVFLLLLILLPVLAGAFGGPFAVAEPFYRAGALVFGGGHVVLPLLEESLVRQGGLTVDEFLAGYGAAQALPGPLFSFAAYLGGRLTADVSVIGGASIAVISIFLPGFLLVAGVLPFWSRLASIPAAGCAVAGVNAAVVGVLGAALYDPIWVSAVKSPADLAIAIVGFVLLVAWRVSALWVVGWCVAATVALAGLPI